MRALGVVLIVAVVLACTFLSIYLGRHGARFVARRWRARRDRHVPWTPYCRPLRPQGKPVVFEVGVHRVNAAGTELSNVEMTTVPLDDDLEREVAMEAARLRAKQYNDAKVGM